MHSWRALILPYLGPASWRVAHEYRFDEPWNGPNNRKLASRMPEVFRCACSPPDSVTTDYVAIVGPGTLWPGGNSGLDAKTFWNTLNKRVHVVEAADARILWMEPRDLEVNKVPLAINAPGGGSISSRHPKNSLWAGPRPAGANVAMADGSARWLPNETSPEELRAILIDNAPQPQSRSPRSGSGPEKAIK